MRPIIVKKVVSTNKFAAGRSVAGKTVMRTVYHIIDSDIITNVAEDFVEHYSPEARSREWPDLKKPPEKLSEIHYVENEILQSVQNVLESVEAIFAKIEYAQVGAITISGVAPLDSSRTAAQ